MTIHSSSRISQYSTLTMPIQEFFNISSDIDLNPPHQRLPVEYDVRAKSQSIIASILLGYNIGQITLHRNTQFAEQKMKFEFESIDGGHRKRAIVDFRRNKLPLGSYLGKKYDGLLYSQLSKEDKEFFDNYPLSFAIYDDLSSRQISRVFKMINTSDGVNHQEEMNASGKAPIASAVREFVRYMGKDVDNTPHMLFEENISNRGKRTSVFFKEINHRLAHDRMVARIFCVEVNGAKPTACDDIEIEQMYEREYSHEELNLLKNKVKKCLNFILKFAESKKAIDSYITSDQFIMLYRLYYTYNSRYNNRWEIKDWDQFTDRLHCAMSENTNGSFELAKQIVFATATKTTTRSDVFKKSLRRHSDTDHWNTTIEYIEETDYMDPDKLIEDGILQLKHSRYVSQELRDLVLAKQNRKDDIDGKPLKTKKFHIDHKISISNGGDSSEENLRGIHSDHNLAKGSLNADQYDAARSV